MSLTLLKFYISKFYINSLLCWEIIRRFKHLLFWSLHHFMNQKLIWIILKFCHPYYDNRWNHKKIQGKAKVDFFICKNSLFCIKSEYVVAELQVMLSPTFIWVLWSEAIFINSPSLLPRETRYIAVTNRSEKESYWSLL